MAKAQKLFQCQPLLLTPLYQKTEKMGNIHITKYPFFLIHFFLLGILQLNTKQKYTLNNDY